MTQEWMLETLMNLGFKQPDAEVYVFLALNGSHRAKDVAEALKTHSSRIYRILKSLQNKEVVDIDSSCPAKFSAVSLEKVFDAFVKVKTEQAKTWQASRKELLATWRSMIKK